MRVDQVREELQALHLPEAVQRELETRQATDLTDEDRALIGQPGYTPPDPSLVPDVLIALSQGKHVLFTGPTGSGKTKLADYLSYLLQQPLHSVNCSVDLDAEALLGFKTIVPTDEGPSIQFVPGPVVKAMEKGHLLYIDELNMARPETLPLINSVLDYRRMITNPFTGEVIHAREGFGVLAAINVGYVGTVPLNEALKNRFVVFEVPYLEGEQLRALLKQESALQDEHMLDRFTRLSADLLAQTKMGQLSDEAASIRALLDACDLAAYLPPLRAIKRAIVDKLEDEREKRAVINIAETWFEEEIE